MSLQLITFAADTDVRTSPTTLAGTVVPFGQVTRFMGVPITFAAGSLELPEDLSTVKLLIQHDQDRPVGYATAAIETDAGLDMIFTLADHPRATELAQESALRLRDGFSVGAEFDEDTVLALSDAMFGEPPEQPITVHGQLREVSAVSVPAFNDARSNASGTVATFAAEPTAEIKAGRLDVDWTIGELAAQVAPLVTGPEPAVHPLARFANLGDFAMAAYTDPELAAFALIDQITTNNPGVIPPGWITEIKGIIDRGTPGITAFGGIRALPDSGMDLNWPYFDGNLATLVGAQATQKTEVTTVRVDIKKGTTALATYAGGSDISYQLLTRSSPSYLEAYGRIMAAAFAVCIDNAFVDAVTAGATGTTTVWVPASGTADALRAVLLEGSAKVLLATGRPASFALVAPDVFLAIGGKSGLWPQMYGTANVSGTADAASLAVNVSGLPIIQDANLAAGTFLISNDAAAAWHGNGPFTATAEDVAKLGRNVAVWGMGATAIYLPAGVVKVPAA